MTIHTEEQLALKKEALQYAVTNFIKAYRAGRLSDFEALMFEIESLNQLVMEYKRG
jgi:hypothetical protein